MSAVVSVIIPCYNQAPFIAEAIESVLAQSFYDWECIVIDDGSTDAGAEIILQYCQKDARIHYFHKKNGGLSSARNYGIAHSCGEFILPLDGDDRIGRTYLEEAVNVFRRQPDTKLVYCLADFFGDIEGHWYLPDYRYEELLIENLIFATCLYRRSDYDRAGGYNENMLSGYEDWDFLLNLIGPQDKVIRIDKVLFFYRQHQGSLTREQLINKQKELQWQILMNHAELYNEYIFRLRESWRSTRTGLTCHLDRKVGHVITRPLRLWREWLRELKYRNK